MTADVSIKPLQGKAFHTFRAETTDVPIEMSVAEMANLQQLCYRQ